MSRFLKRALLVLAIAEAINSASAFSLLGPYDSGWQVERIGYNLPFLPDIGGPMNLGEEYRWNINKITYGFDESFLNYFGARGTSAVMQAMAILNNLPPMSQTSSNLSEFPLNTKRINYQASALGLTDLKSYALGIMMEELGLASPERYVFTLRDRREINNGVQYLVVKRNFDPVTSDPSSYVNDTLYTYYVGEFAYGVSATPYADAAEVPVDPLAFGYTSVASLVDGLWSGGLAVGEFFTGLTRDDVGGLRYLYAKSGRWVNPNIENLLPGTTGSGSLGGDCPWCPITGTNNLGTNNVVDLALRPGVDKINFQLGRYDSLLGNFITVTNQYVDTYITNYTYKTQNTVRVLTQPDILFAAEDLGLDAGGNPIAIARTDTSGWANNDALNGQATLAGPGVIQPEVVIVFSKLGPYLYNASPGFLDEASGFPGFLWGSFDGTTNPPVVYPSGVSIQDLEQQVLGGH